MDNRLLLLLRSLLKATSRGGVRDSAFLLLIVYRQLPPGYEFYLLLFFLFKFSFLHHWTKAEPLLFKFCFSPFFSFFIIFFNLSPICYFCRPGSGVRWWPWGLGGLNGTPGDSPVSPVSPGTPGPRRAVPCSARPAARVLAPRCHSGRNRDERRARGSLGVPPAFKGP